MVAGGTTIVRWSGGAFPCNHESHTLEKLFYSDDQVGASKQAALHRQPCALHVKLLTACMATVDQEYTK